MDFLFQAVPEIFPPGENYRRLKEAGIGTYILFQETYHKPTYLAVHHGPKQNYEWHTEAMDRAMLEGGIDDVGIGPLYGLYDFRYETVALLMHAEHLEAVVGVGPHTISVPRLLPAEGIDLKNFPHLVNDAGPLYSLTIRDVKSHGILCPSFTVK